MNATTIPAAPDHGEIEKLIAFLNGSGELDGRHFGDRDDKGHAFWWRKHLALIDALLGERDAARAALENMCAAQFAGPPYRGWSITKLNKAADAARELLGKPAVLDLNPDIKAIVERADALREMIDARAALAPGGGI